MFALAFVLASIAADPSITIDAGRFRVIDGDTLSAVIDHKPEKIRIVGIDTPESVDPRKPAQAYSKEAAAYLKTLTKGSALILEWPDGRRKTDRYGRWLAYVRLEDSGEDAGYLMVKDGYAHAYSKCPHPRSREYRDAERRARAAGRGLWGGGK